MIQKNCRSRLSDWLQLILSQALYRHLRKSRKETRGGNKIEVNLEESKTPTTRNRRITQKFGAKCGRIIRGFVCVIQYTVLGIRNDKWHCERKVLKWASQQPTWTKLFLTPNHCNYHSLGWNSAAESEKLLNTFLFCWSFWLLKSSSHDLIAH